MPENKNNMMRYAGLATQWMLMLLLAVWGGMWLDKKTAWPIPVFVLLLPLIALFVSLYGLIKEFNNKK